MTERESALSATEGDSFDEFVRGTRSRLLSIAARVVRNHADAQDIVQEALIRAAAGEGFADRAQRYAWLSRVTLNLALMWLRSSKRRALRPMSEAETPERMAPMLGADDALLQRELRELIAKNLVQISPHYRRLIVLRYLEGHELCSIARTTGVTETTLKVQLCRARGQLRRRMSRSLSRDDAL